MEIPTFGNTEMSRSQADPLYIVKPSKAYITKPVYNVKPLYIVKPSKVFRPNRLCYDQKTLKTLKSCKLGLKTHSRSFDVSRLSRGLSNPLSANMTILISQNA